MMDWAAWTAVVASTLPLVVALWPVKQAQPRRSSVVSKGKSGTTHVN